MTGLFKKISCLFLLAFSAACPAFARQGSSDDEILREVLWPKITNSKPPERPAVGLALSGGGARGFAHIGVLEALQYAGFPVDYVSGTSMGAVIGALYASGMKTDDIWNFGREASGRNISRDFRGIKLFSLLITDKLITPTYITNFIEKNLGGYSFEKLKFPFACVAMDFKTGEKIIFTDGPLAIAVRASVNLPGIFAPLEYRHRYLVDGGVVDFIPVDAARLLGAQWVLASSADNMPGEMPENVLSALLQVIDIRGSMLARAEEKEADFLIKSKVQGIKVADFDKCLEAGEAGVSEATSRMTAAKESLLVYSAPRLLLKPNAKQR
ncbi:MAG: patatin-like phospholipase family protein [Elusimicrobia bacterium]|nr:patatin-like phospholipase family protein [Elusimicrobiota bacterium]